MLVLSGSINWQVESTDHRGEQSWALPLIDTWQPWCCRGDIRRCRSRSGRKPRHWVHRRQVLQPIGGNPRYWPHYPGEVQDSLVEKFAVTVRLFHYLKNFCVTYLTSLQCMYSHQGHKQNKSLNQQCSLPSSRWWVQQTIHNPVAKFDFFSDTFSRNKKAGATHMLVVSFK